MADLHFRLQATDEKVASCLQLLSYMQAALTSDPVQAMPREAPTVATDEGPNKAQRPVNKEPVKTEHGSHDEGTTRGEAEEKLWADEPTYIEEEPWPGDLPPMWIGLLPGV